MTTVIVGANNTITVRVDRTTSAAIAAARPSLTLASQMGPRGPRGQAGAAGDSVPPHTFSWGDAPQAVFEAPSAGVLTLVRIQMTTPFNGSGASIRVGTSLDSEAVLPAAWNDPYSTNEFENSPDLAMTEGQEVLLSITPGTASEGSGTLYISFVPY